MPITSKDGFKGNSDTATKLTTPRSINGTNFDGTANITTANWGASRTLTIGNTGKSINGSGNVAWSLSEIGAAAINHGNHVPATQTANNKVFLRNDNTWQSLPTASTSATGIVQLNNAINSTSTTQAATANAVKIAYDKANSAYTMASNSPSLYTYECDFSSDTIYNITLPSGFSRSDVIIVGAMRMNSTNTDVDRPLIVGMDIAMAPFPPGTPENKFSFYYTGGTIREKVRVVIMKVGNLYR